MNNSSFLGFYTDQDDNKLYLGLAFKLGRLGSFTTMRFTGREFYVILGNHVLYLPLSYCLRVTLTFKVEQLKQKTLLLCKGILASKLYV